MPPPPYTGPLILTRKTYAQNEYMMAQYAATEFLKRRNETTNVSIDRFAV